MKWIQKDDKYHVCKFIGIAQVHSANSSASIWFTGGLLQSQHYIFCHLILNRHMIYKYVINTDVDMFFSLLFLVHHLPSLVRVILAF